MREEFIEMYGYEAPEESNDINQDFITINRKVPYINFTLCCQTTPADAADVQFPSKRPFMLLGVMLLLHLRYFVFIRYDRNVFFKQ